MPQELDVSLPEIPLRKSAAQVLTAAGCRVEVCTLEDTILDVATIKRLIGKKCDGVIGQLTEVRLLLGRTLFSFVSWCHWQLWVYWWELLLGVTHARRTEL